MKKKRTTDKPAGKISRRDFIGTAAAGTAVFTIVPRHVLGGPSHVPPSEKINLAGIGLGSRGFTLITKEFIQNKDVQIVAVCDAEKESNAYGGNLKGYIPAQRKVEEYYAKQKGTAKYKGCSGYQDFRELFEKEKDIDAVVIATPDHLHAVIAMMAIKLGKHVYCEKPLAHSIYETRALAEAARKAGVITQMGNQGRAGEGNRLICEWIWDGAIGDVREVYCWTDRPMGNWGFPAGVDRPTDTPPVPSSLDWDLWLGPAPDRPYHPIYHPWKWRGWWDFGCGALGDLGCHIIEPIYWALKLKHPVAIEAHTTAVNSETCPQASIIYFDFPAREGMPPVRLTWYDGGLMPARPKELEQGRTMGNNAGCAIFAGDKGTLVCGGYGESPRLIPESKMQAYQRPPASIPRSIGHYNEWIESCKSGQPAGSNFDYSGLLTEIVLTGNIAVHMGQKIEWDGLNMKATNMPEADRHVKSEYRSGWSL